MRQYFSMLRRRKSVVLTVFGITAVVTTVAACVMPPVFTARTTLLVKFGREFIYRPEVGGFDTSKAFSLEEMVNSEVEILSSRDLVQQVVEEIGIKKLYPDLLEEGLDQRTALAKAVAAFQQKVSIAAVFESSIIRITFEHPSPDTAAQGLQTLAEKFKEKHLEIFGESKSGFLQVQLEKKRRTLADAEETLQSFKERNEVYEPVKQKEALLTQREQAQTQLMQTRLRVSELKQQARAISEDECYIVPAMANPLSTLEREALVSGKKELSLLLHETDTKIVEATHRLSLFKDLKPSSAATVPPRATVEHSRSLYEAFTRLLDLEIKYHDMQNNYQDESRPVVLLRQEILLVKKFIDDQGAYLERMLQTEIRDELSSLQARRKAIVDQLSRKDSEIRNVSSQERKLQAQAISGELASLQVKTESLEAEIARLGKEASALDGKETVLRQLEREVTLNERSFETYALKLEEAKTTEELDRNKIVNIRVIEQATPPVTPSGLSRKTRIALGVVVGLIAGIAAAFFLELLGR